MARWFQRLHPSAAGAAMLLVALAACAWARPSSAQLGEVHGYVEPCTVDNAQEWYTECELCAVVHDNPQACANRLGPLGYEKNCQARGQGTGWNEVWCIDKKLAQEHADAAKRSTQLRMLGLAGVPLLFGALLLLKRAVSRQIRPNPK